MAQLTARNVRERLRSSVDSSDAIADSLHASYGVPR